MLNIKYDIVGSFLRPAAIKEARAKYNSGEITLTDLRKVENEEITRLVDTEVAHGLQIVTNGEFRRRWWHLDWLKEFEGFTTKHLDKERNGVVNHIELGYITGKISYDPNRVHPEVEAYDFLKARAARYPGVIAKKCISGPNMILVDNYLQMGIKEVPYYESDVEYDDERSGSFEPWAILKGTGTTFVAGLISTKNSKLEDYDEIRRRYLEAKAVVGDNIALSPQCGFASVEEGNCIDEETQWKKIDLLVSCRDFL
ncbi:MAG: hypothetical protein IJ390_02610 [Lachnospiraceae bacterium]|nr:hypothetical protein [Lachnospiraceae bacterium]